MPEQWFRQAVIYCLDVDTYQDSDGDGIGDLPGPIDRLDHLARLGVTCIWLNPVRRDLEHIEIGAYGYRWIRLRRTIGARAGSANQQPVTR